MLRLFYTVEDFISSVDEVQYFGDWRVFSTVEDIIIVGDSTISTLESVQYYGWCSIMRKGFQLFSTVEAVQYFGG